MRLVDLLRSHLAGSPLRIPEAERLAWGWFVDLSATRTYHATGPSPIGYAEIEAYARLMRWPLEPRHVQLIRALDTVWLTHARRQQDGPAKPTPRSSGQTVNPAAFDAVFG
jgi:hypothetical protein